MNFNAASKMVTPDKRKGQIFIEQGEDDHLMHLKWKDRTTGTVEDDLIIFPDDIEFKRVPACTTGRVYLLKFKSTSRKMFFWMQEPKTDKDEEHCKKVNDLLNNPPAPGSAAARGGGGGGGGAGAAALSALGGAGGLDLSNLGDSELQSLLNNMNQHQLMQFFGGSLAGSNLPGLLGQSGAGSGGRERRSRTTAGSSSTTTTSSTTSSSTTSSTTATSTSGTTTTASSAATPATTGSAGIQLSDLQGILSGITPEGGAAGSSGPQVDLSSGLTGEMMQPLLTNPDFVKKMKDLLPAEHQGADNVADEIKGTVQSPQFQQALGLFSSAFQSGQLAPLIREFSLGDEAIAAATAGNMEAFVKALQKNKTAEKKDEAEDMALD